MTQQQAPRQTPQYEIQIVNAKKGFLEVVGDERKWSTEKMFALQIIRGNELLQKCKPESITNAVANIALTGTTLNPAMSMAYLVPRKVGGTMQCCLDFSYRGLIKIATDSGSVKHIAARVVYDFDHFEFTEIDGDTHIKHTPSMTPPEDFIKAPTATFWNHLVCGYVIATLFDGTKVISQPLPNWKLKKTMESSPTSSDKSPWRTHPDEMCLKTLLKHNYKTLPQSDRMSYAVDILNEHEGLEIINSPSAGGRRGSRAADAAARVNAMKEEAVDAEYSDATEESGPDICPTCQKLRVEGQCHNIDCKDGAPPPET